jgi:hypothetical protein
MPRIKIAAALLAVFLFVGQPASADTAAIATNVLLGEQIIDVVQTQTAMHGPLYRCGDAFAPLASPANPNSLCRAIEGDDLVRPFVHSAALNVASALAINGLIRIALTLPAFRHGRNTWVAGLLFGAVAAYLPVLIRNQSILHAQSLAR